MRREASPADDADLGLLILWVTVAIGLASATALLAVFWRPPAPATKE